MKPPRVQLVVEINTDTKRVTDLAFQSGVPGLLIARTWENIYFSTKYWTLYHESSGLRLLMTFETTRFADAQEAAKKLSSLCDWTLPKSEIDKQDPLVLQEACWTAIKDLSVI
jgi:hypothetical protein